MQGVVHLDDGLADAEQRRDVAADPDLHVLVADLGFLARQHLVRRLRVDEPLQSALAQRINGDDLDPALHRLLQLVQHPRRRGGDVLRDVEDAVAVLEIGQGRGADRRADALGERDRAALVAHVAAVGQVVAAVHAGE